MGFMSCGGGDKKSVTQPDPPRAASISVSQTSISMSYVGQALGVTATVLDQFQNTFNATVTWASDDPSVATVSTGGLVKAVADGATTVRATSGSLSATVSVTVLRVATRVSKISGDGQTGPVGEVLAEPLVVRAEDTGGAPMPGATVAFTSVVADSVVVTEVTADGQALASTTWTLGTMAGSQVLIAAIAGSTMAPARFNATALAGPLAAIAKASGDQQVVPVGFAVFEPVTIEVTDEYGNGVAGASVAFAVTGGGGSVTPAEGTTGEDGTAQATWVMGGAVGANTLSATAADLPAVEFTATAAEAKADLQVGAFVMSPTNPTSLQVIEVSTIVTNEGYLRAVAGIQVQLLVDEVDAGAVALPSLAIGATSDVTFSIGPLAAGAHAMRIVVDPGGTLDEWDETNNAAQASTDVPVATLITAGTPVSGLSLPDSVELLFTLEVLPSEPGTIEVTLSGGTGDPDLYVHRGDRPALRDDYECQSGNPNTNERCVINAAEPGTYHILIFAWTSFSDISILATTGGPVIPYDIELVFINHGTPEQDAVFATASARWMQIIPGDISDFDFSAQPAAANSCVEGQPLLNGIIDDLRIYVDIIEIDGPGQTLARAGPCFVRGLGFYPIVGSMQFDSDDLPALTAAGDLLPVVMHEMGHVLGIGSIWERKDLLHNPSLPSSPGRDTYFSGPRTIAAFEEAGGATTYTSGNKVPVENSASQGSADSHWRESVLGVELMTPNFNSGRMNPLSAITIESLADLGYKVDITQAEPYAEAFQAPAQTPSTDTVIDLGGDLRQGPIYVMDGKGGVQAVVWR